MINGKSDRVVKAGMVFNVIISLRDMRTSGGRDYAIMLSDTVKVGTQGPELLTNDISKKLEDVSYGIEEEGDEKNTKQEKGPVDFDHQPPSRFPLEELKEGEIFTRSKRRVGQTKVEEEKMMR